MLATGTILQNRYRIIRELGQGGMGAVYEAMDERLDTTVALKETLFADERLRKQFEREARLLARMHHPALPRVSDHFSEVDGQFLVMQYIAGDDLAQMIQRKQGAFPPDQVLTWGDQLLDALDYLHTQEPQIIHRDIKPQNLKLTPRGQIILLDFGLAKGQTVGVSHVTTSASIFGYTPNYAPLEQIQGLGTDARSDIYALSATLYHLMTGVKPPDALTRAASLVNGQPDPLRPANEINGNISPEVAGILGRAMSQNRDQRFATAADMRSALKGSDEVTRISDRTEAPTVLFQTPANTVGDALRPVRQTAFKAGETTAPQAQKRGTIPKWALGIAAVVLMVVLFGGFYAYQRRNSSTPAAATGGVMQSNNEVAQPSPATTNVTVAPEGGGSTGEKKVEVTSPQVEADEAAKSKEKAAKNSEKVARKPSKTANNPDFPPTGLLDRNPEIEIPEHPIVPETNETNPSPPGGRRRQAGGASIRNLPNGGRLITNPDGTRVLVMPDGTTRVFRPGVRINRRRGLR